MRNNYNVRVCNIHHGTQDGVYIGRPSPLGNPYTVFSPRDRDFVCDLYEDWFVDRVQKDDPAVMAELVRLHQTGKQHGYLKLQCYCAPRRCHGDTIKDFIDNNYDLLEELSNRQVVQPPSTVLTRIYAGIGSRKTPLDILKTMTDLGRYLAMKGWMLRSGAAEGADTAFETGADSVQGRKEIWIPWKGFQSVWAHGHLPNEDHVNFARNFHPLWDKLSHGVQKLHSRNAGQIMGEFGVPVDFVVCWTCDGCESISTRTRDTGGTGTAIAMADSKGIPIFNLKNPDALQRLYARFSLS